MIVPIGKITEDNKMVGLVTYDTDAGKRRLLTSSEAFEIARADNSICGMTAYKRQGGKIQVAKQKKYIWDKIPECNGRCVPEAGKIAHVLVGRYIEEKSKKRVYIICDSYGNIEVKDKTKVLEELAFQNIIGIEYYGDF